MYNVMDNTDGWVWDGKNTYIADGNRAGDKATLYICT
jgi:hypothetical protein